MTTGRAGCLASLVVVLATSAGCTDGPAGQEGGAHCPIAFDYGGRTYYGFQTEEPVALGGALGEVSYSTCDDGSGALSGSADAYAVEGIGSEVAIAVPAEGQRLIWLAESIRNSVPREVRRLLDRQAGSAGAGQPTTSSSAISQPSGPRSR
jgi:hypothetical protein